MIFTRLIKELNYRKCAIPTKITNELLDLDNRDGAECKKLLIAMKIE